MNKKSQIAETINWTIATIIIIIVLLVSFFVVRAGETGNFVLPDKQKDFIATKSVVGFVENSRELIESSVDSRNYSEFDKKFKPFLENLYTEVCKDYCAYDGGWNLDLRFVENVLEEHHIYLNPTAEPTKYYEVDFIFPVDDKQIKLRFWKTSGWINL